MKNSIFIFGILSLISNISVVAQSTNSYSLELHDEFKMDERKIPNQYVGNNESGHYFLYSKGKYGYGSSSLVKFSNAFKPTNEEIQLTHNNENALVEENSLGIIKFGNKLLNITTKGTKTYRKFFAKTIDLQKFKIQNEREILNLSISETNMKKSYMSFLQAKDERSVGIFYTYPTKSKENKKYGLIVFDNDFNKIGEYTYEFPYRKNKFEILKGILLNEKEMVVLTADLSNIPVRLYSKKTPNYDYKIVSLNQGTAKTIAEIPNDNKWLNNLDMIIDGSIIKLVGLYSNKGKFDAHGTFFHQIDKSNPAQTIRKLVPFDQNLLDRHFEIKFFGNQLRKKIRKYRELAYYIPKSVLRYDNGTILLIAEQTYTVSQYFITYHFENLIAILIDKNGEQLWSKMIKKNNSKDNTPVYSSYMVLENSNQYVLAYNGNVKNLNKNDFIRYGTFGDVDNESIILVVISKNGVIEQKAIANKPQINGYRIRPGLTAKLNDGEYLLFSQKPSNVKNQRFITLKFHGKIAK